MSRRTAFILMCMVFCVAFSACRKENQDNTKVDGFTVEFTTIDFFGNETVSEKTFRSEKEYAAALEAEYDKRQKFESLTAEQEYFNRLSGILSEPVTTESFTIEDSKDLGESQKPVL